jgi:hypothetical protein
MDRGGLGGWAAGRLEGLKGLNGFGVRDCICMYLGSLVGSLFHPYSSFHSLFILYNTTQDDTKQYDTIQTPQLGSSCGKSIINTGNDATKLLLRLSPLSCTEPSSSTSSSHVHTPSTPLHTPHSTLHNPLSTTQLHSTPTQPTVSRQLSRPAPRRTSNRPCGSFLA